MCHLPCGARLRQMAQLSCVRGLNCTIQWCSRLASFGQTLGRLLQPLDAVLREEVEIGIGHRGLLAENWAMITFDRTGPGLRRSLATSMSTRGCWRNEAISRST